MIRSVMFSFFGVFLFALGAAGSWVMLELQPQADEEATGENDPTPEAKKRASGESTRLPIPVRPEAMTAEEVFRWTAMVKQGQQALDNQREEIQKEELRLKHVADDIALQQSELEGVLVQIDGKIEAAQKILSEIETARQALDRQQQEVADELSALDEARKDSDKTNTKSVKDLAALVDKMDAESSAAMLKELINDGKMQLAIDVLLQVEERIGAKILVALGDPVLGAQIADSLGRRKSQTLKR